MNRGFFILWDLTPNKQTLKQCRHTAYRGSGITAHSPSPFGSIRQKSESLTHISRSGILVPENRCLKPRGLLTISKPVISQTTSGQQKENRIFKRIEGSISQGASGTIKKLNPAVFSAEIQLFKAFLPPGRKRPDRGDPLTL